MRKTTALFILITCLASCHNGSKEASIRGEIKGLGNDTIYLYETDGNYEHLDTIIAQNGKINHTLDIDTVAIATLLFNHETEIPIFLDKNTSIEIQGSVDALNFLTIKGSTPNEEYTAFQQTLKGLGKPSEKVLEEKAEDFIRNHHSSLVSIYLLNTYFIQKASPDFAKIKSLIDQMAGTLQDNPLIEQTKEYTDQEEKVLIGKPAPYFSLPNVKGEKVSRAVQFKDKYLLIHFWASWDEQSMKANAELRKINRDYKKNKKFGMLGISLDMEKTAWKDAIKRDTLTWEQVCEFEGFTSQFSTQFGVYHLPANVLIDPNGYIVARNVKEEELKQLASDDKEKH